VRENFEQSLDVLAVAAGHFGRAAEPAGTATRLLLQQVGAVGLPAEDPAGAGDLEALGRTAVGLLLGHSRLFVCACFGISWW
jgi:hypothetical protein